MIEIYFDGVLIPSINYLGLTQKGKVFDDVFKLGTTLSREFELKIPASVFNANASEVVIVYNSNDYAHLIIDSYETSKEVGIDMVKVKLVDKLVLANVSYDASPLVPTTAKLVVEDICNKIGVEFGNTSFTNDDYAINSYDTSFTAREYLSYIAELAGGYARIEADGKLYIRTYSNTTTNEIMPSLCEQIIIGEKHKVERVVFDNGLLKYQKIHRENYCPPFTDSQWVLSGGAYINDDGNLVLPDLTSRAEIYLDWSKRKNSVYVSYILVSGGNAHISAGYISESGSTLNGNGNAVSNKPDNYLQVVGFGGNNTYGEAISNSKTIKLTFQRSSSYAPNEYCVKNVFVGYKNSDYEPYIYDETQFETLYLNPNNVYITSEDNFEALCGNILDFEYWNIDTGNTLVLNQTYPCDVLKFVYDNVTYYTIEQFDTLNYQGALWHGKYQLEVGSEQQQETQMSGKNTQIKAIKVNMNRIDNTLSIAVQDISSQAETDATLLSLIDANTSLIQQTANSITQSVNEITGQLNEDIQGVASNLSDATNQLSGLIQANTTLIQQLSTSITSTVKTLGGNNLIKNSVGYAGTDYWNVTGNVSTNHNDNMSVSGNEFIINGGSSISQSFNTQVGSKYGVSCKIKHTAYATPNQVSVIISGQGGQTIKLIETTDVFENFTQFSLDEPYVATITNPTITISCDGDDTLEITDLIVSVGEEQTWSGYFDEVYGKEHRLDGKGLELTDLASGNKTKTTSTSIDIIENGNVVAGLSKENVLSNNGEFKNGYKVGKLRVVVLDDDNIIEYV